MRGDLRLEVLALAALSALLAILMTWPLAGHLATEVPAGDGDITDPLLQAWSVAWGGHALVHTPLHFFDANAFWPLESTLAFTDSLAGYAPAGVFGQGTEAATIRYNLLFLFSYALASAGAYLLARELGVRPLAAAVAGACFAYAPFRLGHQSHLHVLSSGGIPLSLFLLARGYRAGRPGTVLAGWLVALWQVSLGWNLGLPFAYVLGLLTLGGAVAVQRGVVARPSRRVARSTGIGVAVFAAGTLLLAVPYMRVLERHPEARRTPELVSYFSPGPEALVAAPHENLVWGDVTSRFRSTASNEKTLFPGATIVLLGLVGLLWGGQRRAVRTGLAAFAAIFALFALGFALAGGRVSYRLLYDYMPGWDGLRTPGRLVTFSMLALAVLAAVGADRAIRCVASRRGARVGTALGVALVALVLLEGVGTIARVAAPQRPATLPRASPQLFLPADKLTNATAMFWSVDGFPKLINGWSSFEPRLFAELVSRTRGFPDAASVRTLRAYGVRVVILRRRPGHLAVFRLDRRPFDARSTSRLP